MVERVEGAERREAVESVVAVGVKRVQCWSQGVVSGHSTH